jgi:molybdopterin biosynthesis enzyme
MKAHRIKRGEPIAEGWVLTRGVGPLQKGRSLSAADVSALADQPWNELQAIELEPGDVHEAEAGRRLAAAAAGAGVEAKPMEAGSFPLAARTRGLVEIEAARMAAVNLVADLALYSHPQSYLAMEGEIVGRVKVVPFVTREERLAQAESLASGGLIRVRPFVPLRCSLLVQEELAEESLLKARRAFEEKLGFFGSTLQAARLVQGTAEALAKALREEEQAGARLIVVAGSRSMDPADPVLGALPAAGAVLAKHGVPVYPGTLLWLAWMREAAVLGAPSCGIFSKVSSLDVVLPRLMTGERVGAKQLSELSAGGIISPATSYRLAPYRKDLPRGQLE